MKYNSHLMLLTNNSYLRRGLLVRQTHLIISLLAQTRLQASVRRNLSDINAVIAQQIARSPFKNKVVGGARGEKRPRLTFMMKAS